MKVSRTQRQWIVFLMTLLVLAATAASAAEPRLIAAVFVKGKVGLKWQTVEGATEYTVYRKAGAGEFAAIHSTEAGQWFDEGITGGETYVYKIGTVVGGAEVFSGEKNVSIPGQVGEFNAPTWVGARVEGPRIMLNWDPVPNAIAYNVFRGTTKGGPYESIGSAQGSRYADNSGLEKGATYYYVLTALNGDFEETPQSEEWELRFGRTKEEIAAEAAEENKIELVPVAMTELGWIERAGSGMMNQPADIFANSKGDLYVTDALNGKVHCFDNGGQYKFSFGGVLAEDQLASPPDGLFGYPFTIYVDSSDQVYVTDVKRNDIQVFDSAGEFLRRITVEPGEGMVALRPNGIHVFDDGRMVVTDTGNHRVLVLDPSGKILNAIGGRGSGPGQFNFPDELVVTPDNKICVVDVINCRVQVLELDGSFVTSFGGVGQGAGAFARPKGIAVDGDGNLWVSDAMSNMIQKFRPNGEVVSAIGTNEDAWTFITPRGIHFSNNKIFIVTRVKNRVGMFALN